MEAVRYVLCSLKTGRVLEEVPLVITQPLSRQLQGYGAGRAYLATKDERCPPEWEQILVPWRCIILGLDGDERIVYHGVPDKRFRTATGEPEFPLKTLEAYFTKRLVNTRVYLNRDQAAIARDLASIAADPAGLPFLFDCPDTGRKRDRTYAEDENQDIYGRLQELAAVEDGFNWTVDVAWADDSHDRVTYTFRTGYPHLGYRTATPEHTFELTPRGGNIADFTFEEDPGATSVRAIGDGDAESRLMSQVLTDTLRESNDYPRLEERENFDGVTERPTIEAHAAGMAARLFGGVLVLDLEVRNGVGTSLGDLTLGDSARVFIDTPRLQLDTVLEVVGWSLSGDGSTFRPTLAKLY